MQQLVAVDCSAAGSLECRRCTLVKYLTHTHANPHTGQQTQTHLHSHTRIKYVCTNLCTHGCMHAQSHTCVDAVAHMHENTQIIYACTYGRMPMRSACRCMQMHACALHADACMCTNDTGFKARSTPAT